MFHYYIRQRLRPRACVSFIKSCRIFLILRWIYYVWLRKLPHGVTIVLLIIAVLSACILSMVLLTAFEYATSLPMQQFGYPLDVDLYKIIDMSHNKDSHLNDIKPINTLSFNYLQLNRDICTLDSVHVLFMVKTTHDRLQARQAIRNTWAKPDCDDRMQVRTVFLLGQLPKSSLLQEAIVDESRHHKDIIQMDFIDNYYNNTYKLMMGLDYATKFCSNARFIVFLDDDYFVNPWEIVNLVKDVHPLHYPRYISGFVWYAPMPMRAWYSKWFVSTWEYAFKLFPDYPTAGTVVISMPLARDIAISVPYTKFHRFDDVFLGVILFKLHIAAVHVKQIYAERPAKITKTVITSHGFKSYPELITTWRDLAFDLRCTYSIQRRKLKNKLP